MSLDKILDEFLCICFRNLKKIAAFLFLAGVGWVVYSNAMVDTSLGMDKVKNIEFQKKWGAELGSLGVKSLKLTHGNSGEFDLVVYNFVCKDCIRRQAFIVFSEDENSSLPDHEWEYKLTPEEYNFLKGTKIDTTNGLIVWVPRKSVDLLTVDEYFKLLDKAMKRFILVKKKEVKKQIKKHDPKRLRDWGSIVLEG